jgi:hypothetical protein
MKIILFISALLTGNNTFCQTNDMRVAKLLDSAKILFCNSDTIGTITVLEEFRDHYPNDVMIMMTNKALANLYLIRGQPDLALEKMKYAIYYKPTKYSSYNFKSDYCSKILTGLNYSEGKADLCISVSQLYLSQNNFDSSLYFLKLADYEYLPYKDCGNGTNMYRSFLSTYFADYYLKKGDTVNAINRLLDFFMNTDGNTKLLTKKLKSILLLKWTQKAITDEVNKGIRQIKFIKKKDDGFEIYITLFGHTIKESGYGPTKSYRQYYTRNKSIDMLNAD